MPEKDDYSAILIDRKEIDELIVFGFTHESLRNLKMKLPKDIFYLLYQFYSCKDIHIIQRTRNDDSVSTLFNFRY